MTLRILQYSDLENAPDDPERVGRVVGALDALRDEETLVVGTGDDLAPGVLSMETAGRHALDFFEAARPDAEAVGNHDFDVGPDALRAILRNSPQPWLCANLFEAGKRFAADAGLRPWTTVEVGDHRVGLVGVLDPDTPAYTPPAAHLTVTDPVEAIEEAAAEMRPGIDHLVVLSHTGIEAELAGELADSAGVDAVVGGHAHSTLEAVVDGVPAVRPGARGGYVAEVVLDGDPTVTLHDVSGFPVHEGVESALRDRLAAAGLDEVVATAAEPIPRTHEAVVAAESRAGNLVTDAYRWATGADVAVVAPGSLREGPPLEGAVTVCDLLSLTPFENDLLVVELDGRDLREAFRELSVTYRLPDASPEVFGHLAGARIVWDDEAGDLVEATVGGVAVDPDGRYTLATSEYQVVQDGIFSAFGPEDVVENAGNQQDAVVGYAREVGVRSGIEGRIRRPEFDRNGRE